MTSIQSTLGDEGIAEELAESQREISIAEFFEKNKHMLGFDSGARGLVTAVKEAVDNALDATEEAGLVPDIYVKIDEVGDYYRLIVEDNGPGITGEQIPKVFGKLLYGSRFHKREQSRGQQGIGISAAVLYSQLTSGKPAKITSRTEGKRRTAQYFELIIDTDTNEPEIQTEPRRPSAEPRPTARASNWRWRRTCALAQHLHGYIKHTAVVNPHARIELREPGRKTGREVRTCRPMQLPAETEEIRPHPHGVELGTLLKMLGGTDSHSVSGFLQEEFTRVGKKTAENVIENFRDRHFGREMAWTPPHATERGRSKTSQSATLEAAVGRNKGDRRDRARSRKRSPNASARASAIAHHQPRTRRRRCRRRNGGRVRTQRSARRYSENAVDAAWDVDHRRPRVGHLLTRRRRDERPKGRCRRSTRPRRTNRREVRRRERSRPRDAQKHSGRTSTARPT